LEKSLSLLKFIYKPLAIDIYTTIGKFNKQKLKHFFNRPNELKNTNIGTRCAKIRTKAYKEHMNA